MVSLPICKKHYYSTFNVITDEDNFFYNVMSQDEIKKVAEEYRVEKKALYLKIKSEIEVSLEKQAQKRANKKQESRERPVWASIIKKNETTDF
ncbi:MAG: hypothetical protein J1G02_06190 [Clostridiales bacterium]|nr:hypothetical protein [Clostridiales bacterium]